MTTTLHPTSAGPHAVVVGAGPTGLALADALGRRLERVTLIERHDIPDHGAPGDRAAPDPPAAAVRRVLHAPRIVVRPGLEVVGLVFRPGRVLGVEVVSRRGGGRAPVTILADLVVDATGWHHDPAICLPDGLILVGRAMAGFSALAEQALAEQVLRPVAGPPTAHGGSAVAVPAGAP